MNLLMTQGQAERLRDALELLVDHQNGCPLPSYEAGWTRAMKLAREILDETDPESDDP